MLEIGSSLHNDSYRADFLIVRLWRLFAKASIEPPYLTKNQKFLYKLLNL